MSEAEYTAALRRAFVDNKADFITVDGWSGPFLHAALAHGQAKGWLSARELHGDQYTVYEGRLTPAGREAFGLPPLEMPVDWRQRAEKAEAERDRLQEALEPFAALLEQCEEDCAVLGFPLPGDEQETVMDGLTWGHLRRARELVLGQEAQS